jgi:hypothetical protein
VDIEGSIKHCPGSEESIGNVRNGEKALEKAWLKSFDERKRLHMINKTCERGCWARERFAKTLGVSDSTSATSEKRSECV